MKSLTAYLLDGHDVEIRPAPLERDWMDMTHQRFAYRCLPLNIANTHGWEILCPLGFAAIWNGMPGKEGVSIVPDDASSVPAVSHFARGILTFHIPCVFRTDPGSNLYITGPINQPKDAITPLTGVVETDWAPYSFTMNWLFTRPNTAVRFEKGEPFCHVFPVQRAQLENIEPRMLPLAADTMLEQQYKTWSADRQAFNAELAVTGSEAQAQRWQKSYFRGLGPTGEPAQVKDHQCRIRLSEFGGLEQARGSLHRPTAPADDQCPASDREPAPVVIDDDK
jgi:Family of unknown function (DUF6065)